MSAPFRRLLFTLQHYGSDSSRPPDLDLSACAGKQEGPPPIASGMLRSAQVMPWEVRR
jgi:hypothetical protein